MALSDFLQLSLELGIGKAHGRTGRIQNLTARRKLCFLGNNLLTLPQHKNSRTTQVSRRIGNHCYVTPLRYRQFKCHSFLNPGSFLGSTSVKDSTLALARLCRSVNHLQGSPAVIKLASAVAIVIFTIWGLGPFVRQGRNIFFHKSDSSWKRSSTFHVVTSFVQPLLLWTGVIFICRALDPLVLPTEASKIVKQRLLTFVRSLSTVLTFAYCLSSIIQQAQKFFMETNDPTNARNMGFQFAGRAVYSAVWVAAVSLFMELLGFSTQRWLTAGGLGTVLLTLAGREIFTNFLSSLIIHATRPFVLNEWIQTKIEGYEVSGTVEHVGWWSPTIIRGDDREAVHIPNHKFTVNVVRNLSQKTHWRIKTHLAISHLDFNKINNIVADMRKVLAKNPQVEQQKLHRRVFLDNIGPENQALLILVSCFVKTSRFEEYLCVKEAILLDLLRVISHHGARLATSIRTVQKIYSDADLESIPYSDSIFTRGAASNGSVLLIEPSHKINGEDKTKAEARQGDVNDEEASKSVGSPPDDKVIAKGEPTSDAKSKEIAFDNSNVEEASVSDANTNADVGKMSSVETKKDNKVAAKPLLDAKLERPSAPKSTSNSKTDTKSGAASSSTSGTKPALEENIVLGVALDGSKRTLPIEEESPSNPEDMKDLAGSRSGNGRPVAETDEKDMKNYFQGSSAIDQSDQKDR